MMNRVQGLVGNAGRMPKVLIVPVCELISSTFFFTKKSTMAKEKLAVQFILSDRVQSDSFFGSFN